MLSDSEDHSSPEANLLKILQFPDSRLRVEAAKVTELDDSIREIAKKMFDTMYATRGVGLAATQVGIPLRLFTMDVSEDNNQPICAINPEILSQEGTQFESEGCLSVATAFDKVKRALKVHLRAKDLDGKVFEIKAEGLMAVCIQHEIDHLNGILFIDHLSRLKRERIRKKIEKIQRAS